jgi:hypothetical protein
MIISKFQAMTFYVILQLFPAPKGWYPITDDPQPYLTMKRRMRALKKENPGVKYRLLKTSY